MWDLIVSVPDHCLSSYLDTFKHFSMPALRIEEPRGVPVAQTVGSLHMLISFLQHLKTVMLKLNQGYMNDFSAASVLTLDWFSHSILI